MSASGTVTQTVTSTLSPSPSINQTNVQEFFDNLSDLLTQANVTIPPAAFDNILTGFGEIAGSSEGKDQTQALALLTGLVGGLGATNLNPDRATAIVGVLADIKPTAETLAGAGDLLRKMSDALTQNLPVGTPLVLGDPASGFAMAVMKVDPAAPAQISLGGGSSLDVPPLAEILGTGASAPLHFAASTSSTGSVYSIGLSQGGAELTVRNLTKPFVMAFPPASTQPNATQQVECVYYEPATRTWLSDGCQTTYNNQTNTTTCACDHLTEFGTRFASLLAVQEGVGKGFVDLFTNGISGKMAPILGFLCGMLATTLLLVCCLNMLDKKAIAKYSKMLELIPQLQQIRGSLGLDGQETWDRFLTKGFLSLPRGVQARKVLSERQVPKGLWAPVRIWWLRLLYQHFYTSLLVRYDPKVPRVLRALFATVSFFTSVAIVIFFYGYKYGLPGEALPAITTAETVVLSLMSSALTVPIMTILRGLMTRAGEWEFRVRYPMLAAEMDRRHLFERLVGKLSIEDIQRQGRQLLNKLHLLAPRLGTSTSPSGSDSDTSRKGTGSRKGKRNSLPQQDLGTSGQQEVGQNTASVIAALSDGSQSGGLERTAEAIELNVIFTALSWLGGHLRCCKKKQATIENRLSLRRIMLYVMRNTRMPGLHEKPCLPYRFFPVHTGKSWTMVGGLIAWMIFTMIYTLAFTSYQSEGTAGDVIRAVATSQAIGNGLIAPITIFTSVLVPYMLTKVLNKLRPQPKDQEPILGAPLTDKLTSLINTRLPVLSSLHLCDNSKAQIDIKVAPINEIIRASLGISEKPLATEARAVIEEIYNEVFHNKGIEKSLHTKAKKKRRGSTSSGSSSQQSGPTTPTNRSPVLKALPGNEMVVEDITDVAYVDL
jgi:hypothetical protein